jgi:glycosyltransferase involved in cell wall biosynthesis
MPYIEEIRRNSNARIVLRAHNIEHEVWKRIARQELNPLKKAYYSIIARRLKVFEINCLNLYDLLVPISARDEETFSRLGNSKPSKVIPVGINAFPALRSYHERELPSLFFIGSLDYLPNQEGLMWFVEKVWKKYLQKVKGLNFFVAGRNAPKKLQHYLHAQPLSFMGEVPDAMQFMCSSDVMVAPVFSGGGIRVKIIEALALGIPVVCTAPAAEGLDLTDGKNILIADDPELFSAAVLKLLENRTFFANIGKNARLFAEENMDGKLLATELLNFYRNHL